MKCTYYENNGYLLLDETGQEHYQEAVKHISTCPECAGKWKKDQEILHMLEFHSQDLAVEPPTVLMEKANRTLSHRSKWFTWKMAAAAAAAIILVAISIITYYQKTRIPVPDEHLAWNNGVSSTIDSLDRRINDLKQNNTYSSNSYVSNECLSRGVSTHLENTICTLDASIKTLSH
jgi:hypothetical protein